MIFICMFDPFGEDMPEYFFENRCRGKTGLKLGDKSYKVCYNVNAFAKAKDGKVRAFLEYVKTQSATDGFTQRLESAVARTKESDAAKEDFMMRNIFIDDWIDQGYDRGVSQGAHDARMETARNFLTLGVATPEQIAQATGLPLAEVQQLAQEIHVPASAR